jgi:replication factor C subunit 2/4
MFSSTGSSSARAPKVVKQVPWVEKYRPKSIDDVAHQDATISTLRGAMATGNLPHLLFYGPPGTGKTSTVLALARGLYGPNLFKERILELNASDERGIKVAMQTM